MKEFRHINVAFKIITKFIVKCEQIETVSGRIDWSAPKLIPGRGTSDNAIIAQKVFHYMQLKKGKSWFLLFKIDLEKTYDQVC